MPFRRKILYYGLMLLLTLLAIEGMARLAYYAAYDQWHRAASVRELPANPAPSPQESPDYLAPRRIGHPFYRFTSGSPGNALNAMPPRQRQADTLIIGLLGGSVAEQVKPYLQVALNRWFAANQRPQRPAVLDLAGGNMKQPQQTLIVTHALLLGGEFDLIVNLDGLNELGAGVGWNFGTQARQVGAELLLAGNIRALRREQARLTAAAEISPLRRSALVGLVNRYRQERIAAAIIQRNHELAALEPAPGPKRRDPQRQRARYRESLPEIARFWYRSSLTLARLAELAGAEYYHFLQPNQYLPGAKPLSPEEWEFAWSPEATQKIQVELGYPLLREFSRDLSGQGINYFDLTGIFADRPETLYVDDCCHLNGPGNELLAAEMLRRMEPSLRRWLQESPPGPVSALAAARRPAQPAAPPAPPNTRDFQVSFQEGGKQLRYVRENCVPEDAEPQFFLHLIPRDLTDLPPRGREQGFDNRDFLFWEDGGHLAGETCALLIRLPDYPIAALSTGQTRPGQGPLWSVELIVPIDAEQLRADYAALAAAEPTARDYFDLYDLDNRLLYLRESCAAADTAASFFLHIIPENPADLPADKRPAGFDHAGFVFARQGGHFDGKCLAAVSLPDYPVKEMRTGQHIPGQDAPLWSVQLIAAPDYAQLRADYAALSAAQPVEQAAFDLYLRDNRLLYRRENCAAGDTAAGFFLHIVPENPADLPADRREAGFAHAGFVFARQGGHFDGKCLAAVALPDYPIKEMRTGQYVAGQGDLWSARLIIAP